MTNPTKEPILQTADIQGSIAPGFASPYQLFIGVKIASKAAGQSLLKALLPHVSSMEQVYAHQQERKQYLVQGQPIPNDLQANWLNLALSAPALRRFNRPEIEPLDASFGKGMAALSGALGDPRSPHTDGRPNPGHKSNWVVGGPDNEVDLFVILAASTLEAIDQRYAWFKELVDHTPDAEIIYLDKGERLPENKEHFGFSDGIAQPGIRGLVPTDPPEPLTTRYVEPQPPTGPEFGRPGQPLIWPGQFILGYPVQAKTSFRTPLPAPENLPPLARNGSFLVFRRLRQDVAKFKTATADLAQKLQARPDLAHLDQERLQASFVGRWPSGAPLSRSPERDDPALGQDRMAVNYFGFNEAKPPLELASGDQVAGTEAGDFWGHRCPRFAHIRQVNPRDMSTDQGPAAQTLTHTILRRGITFGPLYYPDEPPDSPNNQQERGLIFLSYQASIRNQFEVLHNRWINSEAGPEDAGLDILVGQNHDPNRPSMFRVRTAGGAAEDIEIETIDWVIPTGGGYFFAPSISAIEALAQDEVVTAAGVANRGINYQKIAPALLTLVEDFQEEQQAGLAKHQPSLDVVAPADSPKPARVVVFITCDEQAAFDHLAPEGIEVNQSSGRTRTAILPIDKLGRLSQEAAVKRISPSHRLKPTMDQAVKQINLPQFRQKTGLTGKGVIIGIIDSGIDPTHPAFAGRILRIWDQTLPRSRVLYGRELSGLADSQDDYGHGTHMAGIAAGQGAIYGGIAPGAELAVVKTGFGSGHIGDGVRYVFDLAEQLQRPAVVNISIGGHDGPHDGTDDLSLTLESLLNLNGHPRPGRIICCSAGNEGRQQIHARTRVPANGVKAVRFTVPKPDLGTGNDPNPQAITVALLNGWYSGQDQLEVSVEAPGGARTAFQPVIPTGYSGRRYDMIDARINIFTPGPDFENGDHNFAIWLEPRSAGGAVTPGVWRLLLRGRSVRRGLVDIWSVDNNRKLVVNFEDDVEHRIKIGEPGAAASVVTVAASTSKLQWQNIDGVQQLFPGELRGLAAASSAGPLRTGGPKPDVTAPGEWIVSALAKGSVHPRAYIIDSEHVAQFGTSMSTAIVSGIAALMLERNPQLTYAQFKEILRANSAVPGQPQGAFDPYWGYGLIDLLNL